MAGVESQRRSRMPGQRASSASIISCTVPTDSFTVRSAVGKRLVKRTGSRTKTGAGTGEAAFVMASSCPLSSLDHERFDRGDHGQVLGDAGPAVTFVGADVERPGPCPKIHPRRIETVGGECLAQHSEEGVLLGQALPLIAPGPTCIPCPPH